MTGHIRLGRWLPFVATEWIDVDRGFVWSATVGKRPLRITGRDGYVDGRGAMAWRLWGAVPFLRRRGTDVDRSAEWRFLGEAMVWLPGARNRVQWRSRPERNGAYAEIYDRSLEPVHFTLSIDEAGVLRELSGPRWGKPPHAHLGYHDFVVKAVDEISSAGMTVPGQVHAGWMSGGELRPFFRATVSSFDFDDAAGVTQLSTLSPKRCDRRRHGCRGPGAGSGQGVRSGEIGAS